MNVSLKTKGTEVFFVKTDSNGPSIVKLGCPKGVSGLGGAKTQIDETCLDSLEMEFGPGMGQPGAITINLDFDPAKVSHQDLIEMDQNDTVTTWIVALSDGATTIVPTIDSAGTITFPGTRSFIEFDGYIAELPFEIAVNANVTSALSVQRTGAKTFHWKA
jgi:hypothetical protein